MTVATLEQTAHLQSSLDIDAILAENEHLRNHIDFHRRIRHEIDQLPSEILDGNKKMTLTHILEDFYFNRLEVNADGYAYIEPWRYAEYCGESTGTANSHINYLSDVHEDDKLDRLGVLPLFDKRLVKIPDETGEKSGEKDYAYDTYLKPRSYAFETGLYKFYCRKTRNIGGANRGQGRKPKCEKCKRPLKVIETPITSQITEYCKHCNIKHVYPVKRVNIPEAVTEFEEEAGNQIDFAKSESDPEQSEIKLTSQDQDATVKNQFDAVEEDILPYQIDTQTPLPEPENQIDSAVEDSSNNHHILTVDDATAFLTDWLRKRIGAGQMAWHTGCLDEKKAKYLCFEQGYTPDINAYLDGNPWKVYASPLITDSGLTSVLCDDIDEETYAVHLREYMSDLAQSGFTPAAWERRPGRWHLEVYWSEPVTPQAAFNRAVRACPGLAKIPEAYPVNNGIKDCSNQRLSWPLYHRIGDQAIPCKAIVAFPDGEVVEHSGICADRLGLAQLLARAVTPASLIREQDYPAPPHDDQAGGWLLDKPSPKMAFEDDLIAEFIVEFNRTHPWGDIAKMCGGYSKTGHFKAVWRREQTASVKPDKDGRKAHDYGKTGNFPTDFDQYEAHCLIKGIDKRSDLRERLAAMRQGVAV